MIDFKITDENDNVIFRTVNKYSDMAHELSYGEIRQCLNDSSSDMFNLYYDCDEENFHYSVLKHTDRESILTELPDLIKEYNSHVAALPEYNPAEHDASVEREGVSEDSEDVSVDTKNNANSLGRLEPCYRPADGLSPETIARMWGLYKRYPYRDYWKRPYSWWKTADCKGWCDVVKPKTNVDSLFGHFECRLDGAGCEGRGGRGGRDDVLSVIPGSFSGRGDCDTVMGCDGHVKRVVNCFDKPSKSRDDSCERGSCEGASDDVEPAQEWELTETQKHEISVIEDFIGYLRTQKSWATLLNELNFYHDPDDPKGKAKLIHKFREHMLNKEKQENKNNREEKR